MLSFFPAALSPRPPPRPLHSSSPLTLSSKSPLARSPRTERSSRGQQSPQKASGTCKSTQDERCVLLLEKSPEKQAMGILMRRRRQKGTAVPLSENLVCALGFPSAIHQPAGDSCTYSRSRVAPESEKKSTRSQIPSNPHPLCASQSRVSPARSPCRETRPASPQGLRQTRVSHKPFCQWASVEGLMRAAPHYRVKEVWLAMPIGEKGSLAAVT